MGNVQRAGLVTARYRTLYTVSLISWIDPSDPTSPPPQHIAIAPVVGPREK